MTLKLGLRCREKPGRTMCSNLFIKLTDSVVGWIDFYFFLLGQVIFLVRCKFSFDGFHIVLFFYNDDEKYLFFVAGM